MTLRALAHDVGKYVARTARNLPAGEIPPVLVEMLCRDLYAIADGRHASGLFAELAAGRSEPEIEQCRIDLVAIDALEPRVRAGQEHAVREAAALALQIEARLRALLEAVS